MPATARHRVPLRAKPIEPTPLGWRGRAPRTSLAGPVPADQLGLLTIPNVVQHARCIAVESGGPS